LILSRRELNDKKRKNCGRGILVMYYISSNMDLVSWLGSNIPRKKIENIQNANQ
jgi:hypothetical protein